MKNLLGIVVLGLLLSTSAYTDDIKDFQIERISIGDSDQKFIRVLKEEKPLWN